MEYKKFENPEDRPNLLAQQKRHNRVFLKSVFFTKRFFRLMLDVKSYFLRNKKRGAMFMEVPMIVKDPFAKFLRQTVAVSAALLVVTSFAPSRILETGFTADAFADDTDFIEEIDEPQLPSSFLMNEEGFVLKGSPASEDTNRIGFTDSVQHSVVSGDTLSTIAALYGISVKTLVWENGLSENSILKIGTTLVIPPLDGVSHTVSAKNETLTSIAKNYSADIELIKKHNNLTSDVITKGQKLFIPGGKKKEIVLARAGSRSAGRVSVNTFDPKVFVASNDSPGEGKELIFPTTGKLTQGFRRGHYAQDIGNTSKPDIWASSAGTVMKAVNGCAPRGAKADRSCGGGYGNHVVVDHGDGLQTLYAHMETVYVTDGQYVESGQALGKMGNSGRVYGATGIHLHFEVIDNGVKKNPANYY